MRRLSLITDTNCDMRMTCDCEDQHVSVNFNLYTNTRLGEPFISSKTIYYPLTYSTARINSPYMQKYTFLGNI